MSKIYRGEMQDNLGNTIYPHTEAGLVYCSDGETVQEKIAGTAETLDGITGVSDSTELDDNTKLATSKAVNTLRNNVNSSLGGNILSYVESEDAYYIQYGADTVPKKLGDNTDWDLVIEGFNKPQTVYSHSNSFNSAWSGESIFETYTIPVEGIYSISSTYSPSGKKTHNDGTHHLTEGTTIKTTATNNNANGTTTAVKVSLTVKRIYEIS